MPCWIFITSAHINITESARNLRRAACDLLATHNFAAEVYQLSAGLGRQRWSDASMSNCAEGILQASFCVVKWKWEDTGHHNVVLHDRESQAFTLRGVQTDDPAEMEKVKKNVVRCQEKGLMDETLVLDWITSAWCQRPEALLGLPSLLVLRALLLFFYFHQKVHFTSTKYCWTL